MAAAIYILGTGFLREESESRSHPGKMNKHGNQQPLLPRYSMVSIAQLWELYLCMQTAEAALLSPVIV